MEHKTDRRVIRTKKAICNALIELLATKTLNEITIKEIADLADVNRKTVYNYYSGVHDILEEIEDTIVLALDKVLIEVDMYKTLENPIKIFDTLNNILRSNLDFYRKLLNINASSKLVSKIILNVSNKLKKVLVEGSLVPKDKVELFVTFVVGGMLNAYQYWFNTDSKIPIETFSNDVSTLVFQGVKGIINK